MAITDLNKLCSPAQLYLFLTLFSLVVMVYENVGTYENTLCVGNYECYNTPSKITLVFVKLIYIGFWTFVLNLMCNAGYKTFAWVLVLFPILSFVLLLIFALGPWTYKMRFREGMEDGPVTKCDKSDPNYKDCIQKWLTDSCDKTTLGDKYGECVSGWKTDRCKDDLNKETCMSDLDAFFK